MIRKVRFDTYLTHANDEFVRSLPDSMGEFSVCAALNRLLREVRIERNYVAAKKQIDDDE